MKVCIDCQIIKPASEFHPSATNRDGLMGRCKNCRNLHFNKKNPEKVIRKIYFMQVRHSADRGHPSPIYSPEQLWTWAQNQPNWVLLWNAYVASGFDSQLKPSVDRDDPNQSYTISNISLMTWKENRLKGASDRKSGAQIDRHRAVQSYFPDGTFIRKYVSVSAAARDIGGNDVGIHRAANGVRPSYKRLIWKWA